MKKIIYIFLFCIIFKTVKAQDTKNEDTLKSVLKHIPLTLKGALWPTYMLITKTANLLKLDDLNKGYDSIQIRIWSMIDGKRRIFIIKQKNGMWSSEFYEYTESAKKIDQLNPVIKEKKILIPRSDWNSVFKSLDNLNITKLRDMRDIPNYPLGADGYAYFFEIATINDYRFCEYWIPEAVQDEVDEAKKVVEMLKIISEEFSIELK